MKTGVGSDLADRSFQSLGDDADTAAAMQRGINTARKRAKGGAAASRASRTQNKTGRPEGKPVPQI